MDFFAKNGGYYLENGYKELIAIHTQIDICEQAYDQLEVLAGEAEKNDDYTTLEFIDTLQDALVKKISEHIDRYNAFCTEHAEEWFKHASFDMLYA